MKTDIRFCLLFLLFLNSFSLVAQNFNWAKKFGGSSKLQIHGVNYDKVGNTYIIGGFESTFDFDPDTGTFNLSPMSAPSGVFHDLFIVKLGRKGELKWAKRIGGSLWDIGRSVNLDSQGNIILSGTFSGSVDYDPGPGSFFLTTSTGGGAGIIKLDTAGNFVWAKTIAVTKLEKFVLDEANGIYAIGVYNGTTDFDPDAGVYNLTTPNNYLASYVLKLNSNGSFGFVKAFSGSPNSYFYITSLFVDKKKNIYLTGNFEDTIDFDPDVGVFTMSDSLNADIFVSKLDSTGKFKWAKSMPGARLNSASEVSSDANGNVFIIGTFRDTVDFDPGSGVYNLFCANWFATSSDYDIFIEKLDSNGSFVWAQKIGGNGSDFGYDLALDKLGNVYITGTCFNSVDLNPGAGTFMVSGNPVATYLVKLTNSGAFVWGKAMWGPSNSTRGFHLAVDDFNEIYLTGEFDNSTYFTPPSGGLLTSTFGYSAFVVKHNQCFNSSSNINIVACNKYKSPSGKYTWISTGVYKDTIFNTLRCDSFLNINLTINTSSSSTITISRCNSFTSPSGKRTWTISGVYKDTLTNNKGCDSVITINLTINKSSTSTISPVSCNSYTSPSGKYVWLNSGTYRDTIPNVNGCDSVVVINLTINPSSVSSFNVSRCNSYTSPSGKYIWGTSGTYKDTLINAKGCDSLITIYLSIINHSVASVSISKCNTYKSPSGKYTWNNSGVYNDTIPNAAGCDSIITINLTINKPSFSNFSVKLCNGQYISPSGKYTWSISGNYLDTVSNYWGCDSIISIQFENSKINDSIYWLNDTLFAFQNNATSYQWLSCGAGFAPIQGATNYLFRPVSSGLYSVQISQNNCIDTSSCFNVVIGSINPPKIVFSLWPNPVKSELNVVLDKGAIESVYIYTLIGKLVWSGTINDNSFTIPTADFTPGFYFLSASTQYGEKITLKFLKE